MIPYVVSVLTMAAIYALAALGLNLQFGIAGLFNVGCAGFFAAGAYASAVASGPPFTQGLGGFGLPVPLGLLAGMALAALLALLVAAVVLRLQGDYLAIATFGLAVSLQIAATNAGPVTGGPGGLAGIPRPFGGGILWLIACLAALGLAWVLLERLDRAAWGRALRAVSEDATAAAAAGKNVAILRLQAFVIGAALTGLAGALYVHNAGFVSPQDILPILTFQLYAMVIAGGRGRHAGAMLGALLVWTIWSASGQALAGILPPSLQARAGAIRVLVIALALLTLLRLRPQGLLPDHVGRRLYKR